MPESSFASPFVVADRNSHDTPYTFYRGDLFPQYSVAAHMFAEPALVKRLIF
jgi:hypothetical protein